MTRIAILAGSWDQAEEYVQPYIDESVSWKRFGNRWIIDDVEYIYLTRGRSSCCGMLLDAYVIVGNFSDRPDAGDIMTAILPCLGRR